MKSNLTRLWALVLALLMVVTAFAMTACADETPDDGEKDPAQPPEEEEQPEEPEEEPRLPIDYLPEQTYDDMTINILQWTVNDETPGNGTWIPWEEIDVESRSGDTIGDAIYDRNGQVEEKFDVTITHEYASVNVEPNYFSRVYNNHSSGDDFYQMITMRTTNINFLCMDGYMANMYEMEYLHTDMPWWNQDSVRSYTMGSALYFAAPEMLLLDKGATALMFYNHTVATNASIGDLYTIAENGEWTMEKMVELSEGIAADMDGDDQISSAEDMYGMTGDGRDIPYYLFSGAGMKFAEMDDDGHLELTFDDDGILMWQDVVDKVMFSEHYYCYSADWSLIPDNFDVFKADKCLFSLGLVKAVNTLRNMSSDYGVLPIPKYDEDQKDYSSLVWMHHDSVLGIPTAVQQTEAVSVALEYMSYLSYYEVYGPFYDTIILGRSARDEQSKRMLEKVFETRAFDPGQYWLSDAMHGDKGFLTVCETNTRNIASLWASLEEKTYTAIDAFNKRIDEMGG